ncbi:MAG: hypothetical protein J1E82_07355 [Muribaculaceae bacterium]|nr:hypothetical protein [Muribaculaceae bacterium]
MKNFFTGIHRIWAIILIEISALSAFAAPNQVEYTLNQPFSLSANYDYAVFIAEENGILTADYGEEGLPKGITNPGRNLLYQNLLTSAGEIYAGAALQVPFLEYEMKDKNNFAYQSWEVFKGQTYYAFANTDVPSLTLSFETADIADPKESAVKIEFGKSVMLGNAEKIGRIVIPEEGILTATAGSAPFATVSAYMGKFLRTEDNAPVNSDAGGINNTGWVMNEENDSYTATYTTLKEGIYYVYYESETPNIFEFDFIPVDDVIVTLTSVGKQPGLVLDPAQTAIGNGIKFTFSPQTTTIGSATLQYVSGGQIMTKPLTVQDVKDGWNIGGNNGEIYYTISEMDKESEAKIILTDVNWDGKYLSASALVSDYIEIGDDGTLTVTYFAPGNSFSLLSQSWPSELVPYANPGSEYGYATLEFNYDLQSINAELLFYSNYNLGSMVEVPGQVTVPVIIEGNKAVLNFSNIDLTKVNGYAPLRSFSVVVQGIYSTNGYKFDSFVKDISYNAEGGETMPEEIETVATMLYPEELNVLEPVNPLITWNYSQIELTNDYNYAILKIDSGVQYTCLLQPVAIENENGDITDFNNALELLLPENLTAQGVYNFTLPANTVKNAEGKVNSEASFKYVYPAVNRQWTSNIKENGVYTPADLNEVAVTWNFLNAGESLSQGIADSGITITSQDGNVMEVDAQINENSIVINISELSDGNYTLTIPYAFVWIGSHVNPAISINFGVSDSLGVSAIPDQDIEHDKIYNLQGIRVNPDRLAKGIYIINGKKVIKR